MVARGVGCVGVLFLLASAALPAGDERAGGPSQEKPDGAPLRLGNARFANLGRVFALAYSADSRLLAGGAWDGSIRVWEAASAKELLLLHEHKGPVRKLAFSRDGKWLAS